MEEWKEYLGWDFYFNLHTFNLMEDNAEEYIGDLVQIQQTKQTNEKIMESVVEKINIAGFFLLATQHFTAWFRMRISKCRN